MPERKERRGLGRGLSALMADLEPVAAQPDAVAPAGRSGDRLDIAIELIEPNPEQPRRSFTESDLEDLTASIRQHGIIQPLIIRRHPERSERFQIVAGERRWRAAQRAALHQVPAIIRDFSDSEVLEVAIIENIQRADLNPIEEANGYRQLMSQFGHTQEKLAEALGKSRSHIANSLRLLKLPVDVLAKIESGELTAGHARALITSDDATELAHQVVSQNLSVRETEQLVRAGKQPAKPRRTAHRPTEKDADTRALELDLSAHLGLTVRVDHVPETERGKLVISYANLSELDDLCRLLSGERS
ncbi:ParB/RepB/Spo0J family partition protein [Palleronia caenipelagi]|uniref:ParB/RepB/Spo0J family partition protein n=1 Tax=Palleronia caenipelagi TaxID=2489174 RepID=A0A547Q8T0_9RHOB|nr:ParB/RepB/Spo0J family partition protein [Palleronia caenipelagi]TRD22781.1 ParB/RepB/Spo0J family partition protein [Palleronia caenipelagi]